MDIFRLSMRCLLAGSWPSARHDQAQWLGTDKARAARGRKEALGCHALLLQVRGGWAWYKSLIGFKGWASGRPDTAQRRSWRARPSKGSVSTLCSLCVGFRPSSFASMCCTRWTRARRRTRLDFFRSGRRLGWDTTCFLFPVCVSALVCLCVCSSVLRVHVQLCFVSPAGPGFFCAQPRSGRIAELWNRIKLHYKTFHTQSRLQKLTWEMIRVDQKPAKLRA